MRVTSSNTDGDDFARGVVTVRVIDETTGSAALTVRCSDDATAAEVTEALNREMERDQALAKLQPLVDAAAQELFASAQALIEVGGGPPIPGEGSPLRLLSIRTWQTLKRAGMLNEVWLRDAPDAELLTVRGIGPHTLAEIREVLG